MSSVVQVLQVPTLLTRTGSLKWQRVFCALRPFFQQAPGWIWGAFHLNTYSSIRTCIFLNIYQLPTVSRTLCEAWGPWEKGTDLISRSP